MKNLYLVISETMVYYPPGSGIEPPLDPPEPYCIACLVVARKPSQAVWLAWKTDRDCTGTVIDMPKMSCNLRYTATMSVRMKRTC